MRKVFLALSILAAGGGLTGCRGTGTSVTASSAERAHRLDNFGEILSGRKASTAAGSTHGAQPADNFGEIL